MESQNPKTAGCVRKDDRLMIAEIRSRLLWQKPEALCRPHMAAEMQHCHNGAGRAIGDGLQRS